MQNLGMIMRLLKRMTPSLDVKGVTAEIRDRIGEELDYELEAQNQRSLARIFKGHPFIVVPEVVSELSREHVLVTDFVRGVGFEQLKEYPQAERDRIGEIVFRFFLGCLYRHRQFSGDPHPGNFMLLEDGRVAFLDFGLFKRLDREPVELELACQRAVVEGDAQTLHMLLAESRFLPEPERVDPDHLLAFIEDCDLVVHDRRRRGAAQARDRDGGDDRELGPALLPLSRDAPSDDPARAPVRAAHGDADASGALAVARAQQLAPDRARVDVRRCARYRAGARGGGVLRAHGGGRRVGGFLGNKIRRCVSNRAIEAGCNGGSRNFRRR